MSDLFWLTTSQLARIEPCFPLSHGKPRVDGHAVRSLQRRGQPSPGRICHRPRPGWGGAGDENFPDRDQRIEAVVCNGTIFRNTGG